MGSIAILYICTGVYKKFWQGFFESYEQNFLPNTRKEYYIFTDAKNLKYQDCDRVHIYKRKPQGWPYDTLFRFDMFWDTREDWKHCDYAVFINANFRCVTKVLEEEFLPREKRLLVASHAASFGWNPDKMDYCRDPQSLAYIPYGQGQFYVMGGLNGGKTPAYLEMIKTLMENIRDDYNRGVIAVRHDESHINHYILGREDYKLLPPSYGCPEEKEFPFKPRMLLLDKSKYFDTEVFKAEGIGGKILVYLLRIKRKIRIRVRIKNMKERLKKLINRGEA